ncbi:LysR family transcriptional regulator [Verticiella sediminum]|uniref:LysR family transcriptional regulator n=1 Tax=Verticiella sediminum TaxID=1247510 RepID=A0A556AY25_9BURK|nr:LysR family transcriptional regulator [Verticiella sediminum]TSH97365.1 LysR family transcriptional regulator [Verticiella sediminum]
MDPAFASSLERAFRSGLKLGHLRLLSSLARVGRVSRVAELLNVTQPAVSKQLAELEAVLGTPVVVRAGRSVALTPAGEILVRYGREILHRLDDAKRELEDLGAGLGGGFKVGAVATVMPTLIAAAVGRWQRLASKATLVLKEATTDELFPLLDEGELDLVVSRTRVGRSASGLTDMLVGNDPIVLACSHRHPLAGRKAVRWADVAGYPWVLPPEGSAIHDALRATLERNSIAYPERSIVSNSIAALPRLLTDGHLVGPVPRAFIQEDVDRRKLMVLPLALAGAAHEVRAVWRPSHATPLLRLFVKSLTDAGAGLDVTQAQRRITPPPAPRAGSGRVRSTRTAP